MKNRDIKTETNVRSELHSENAAITSCQEIEESHNSFFITSGDHMTVDIIEEEIAGKDPDSPISNISKDIIVNKLSSEMTYKDAIVSKSSDNLIEPGRATDNQVINNFFLTSTSDDFETLQPA